MSKLSTFQSHYNSWQYFKKLTNMAFDRVAVLIQIVSWVSFTNWLIKTLPFISLHNTDYLWYLVEWRKTVVKISGQKPPIYHYMLTRWLSPPTTSLRLPIHSHSQTLNIICGLPINQPIKWSPPPIRPCYADLCGHFSCMLECYRLVGF